MTKATDTINNCSIKIILFIIIIPFSSGLSLADKIVVEQGESIQAAIEKATPGDVIEVKSGIYNLNWACRE